MSPSEFRSWLTGLLEGLACREVDPRLLDRVMAKVEEYRGEYRPTLQATEEDASPTPQPSTLKAALDGMKGLPKKKLKASATPTELENSTPVAPSPPYNPDNPQVVRLG